MCRCGHVRLRQRDSLAWRGGAGTGARGFSLLELCKDHLAPWLHAFHSIALKRILEEELYFCVIESKSSGEDQHDDLHDVSGVAGIARYV